MDSNAAAKRDLLRHALATLAYRGGKAVGGAPQDFSAFRVKAGSRTPGEILAHVGDLLDWALSLARGAQVWRDSAPQTWDRDVSASSTSCARSSAYLGWEERSRVRPVLVAGPIADALTHVGQMAMLRRLAGSPVRGENYLKADIVSGRVGPEQSTPRREFD